MGPLNSTRPKGARRGISLVAAVALPAILLAGPAAPVARALPADGRPVKVTLEDFSVKASQATVRAGTVVLHIHNAGPSTHEINVDRTNDAASELPLKADGLTVDEDDPSLRRIDSIEELDLGTTGDLTLRLQPGHYVFYCNLEGHYLGGMHAALNVVARGKS